MIHLATFAVLFAVVYSYGVPQAPPPPPPPPQYNPAPAPQYAPPPPPPQYRPVYYPVYWWDPYYYYDSWEDDHDDHHHHHHHHHEEPNCGKLWTTCNGWLNESQCREAQISYYNEKNCKKAVIKCGNYGHQMQLVTGDGVLLAVGTPITKVATCKGRGEWRVETADGRMVDVDTVRCVTLAR
ncbi:hypothetical protein Aduo_018134 [Ancylostoma duodenale]